MNDGLVQVFDVGTYALVSTVTLPGATGRPVGTLASPDGAWLYVATTADGRVHAIDVAAGVVTRSFDVGVEPDGLAFGPGPD
jgi:YVTN family beta-propeller protein